MQSWFFLGGSSPPKVTQPVNRMSAPPREPVEQAVQAVLSQPWTFSVKAPGVKPMERVFITGSTEELGEWDVDRLVPMRRDKTTGLWSRTVIIPNTCHIGYRYVIALINEDTKKATVKLWETNISPRVILETMRHPTIDTFGEYGGKCKVDSGWLTAGTLLQFKFMKNPLKLKIKADQHMYIKVTPVKLSIGDPCDQHWEESSQSSDFNFSPDGVNVNVSTLHNNPAMCKFHPQSQFGTKYKPNDVLLVNICLPDHNAVAYLVDLYSYSSRAGADEPPCHVGYTYLLPNMFKYSVGSIELPVTCHVKHRPLGTIYIEYLIVKPMPENLCDLSVSYSKYWNPAWTGLDVGHRGLGASFKTKEGNAIRENTVASLKQAAANGADLLEFDVQLSKDMIPVIYHDFYVCISMKRKKEVSFSEMLELPVKDLTLEHLQKLKVYHLVEGRTHEALFHDEHLEEHQPFPTLKHLLKEIDSDVGFNVELKWNMELDDGTFELDNPFDMNVYVDKVLEVVLTCSKDRRIVFSCFNPDICTMVRIKQNKYPVMFLTQGVTDKYQPYRDPRCLSIPAAVQSAISSDILGIVVHTEDLLRDPTQVSLATDVGLVIFCWGDDNNDKNTVKKLKLMGLHAVIYDKLDKYAPEEVKESVFMVEARESEKEFMRISMDVGPASSSASTSESGSSDASEPPRYLDLAARTALQDYSTATLLESLDEAAPRPDPDERRKRAIIHCIDKESQLKELPMSFRGRLPSPPPPPKKKYNPCAPDNDEDK